ncbi:MAG: AMP-binding protein, partial [Pseudonocardia sp.]|nr:AMP-binding protein [Pseudonocardia sp.]
MTEPFNAAVYLTERRVAAGDGERTALHHPRGSHTYGELADEVRRVAGGLVAIGVRPEERVLLSMVDDVELVTGILAAMYIGAVAVPCSTMLTGPELAKLVVDSRARVLLGSSEFAAAVTTAAEGAPDLRHLVLTGDAAPSGGLTWDTLRSAEPLSEPYATWDESPALWLYTSGTTGTPKGAMHRHVDIRFVCETYARDVLHIGPDDVCLSGAKLFFAYGIGNSMFFPLAVGASAVLEPAPPAPPPVGAL